MKRRSGLSSVSEHPCTLDKRKKGLTKTFMGAKSMERTMQRPKAVSGYAHFVFAFIFLLAFTFVPSCAGDATPKEFFVIDNLNLKAFTLLEHKDEQGAVQGNTRLDIDVEASWKSDTEVTEEMSVKSVHLTIAGYHSSQKYDFSKANCVVKQEVGKWTFTANVLEGSYAAINELKFTLNTGHRGEVEEGKEPYPNENFKLECTSIDYSSDQHLPMGSVLIKSKVGDQGEGEEVSHIIYNPNSPSVVKPEKTEYLGAPLEFKAEGSSVEFKLPAGPSKQWLAHLGILATLPRSLPIKVESCVLEANIQVTVTVTVDGDGGEDKVIDKVSEKSENLAAKVTGLFPAEDAPQATEYTFLLVKDFALKLKEVTEAAEGEKSRSLSSLSLKCEAAKDSKVGRPFFTPSVFVVDSENFTRFVDHVRTNLKDKQKQGEPSIWPLLADPRRVFEVDKENAIPPLWASEAKNSDLYKSLPMTTDSDVFPDTIKSLRCRFKEDDLNGETGIDFEAKIEKPKVGIKHVPHARDVYPRRGEQPFLFTMIGMSSAQNPSLLESDSKGWHYNVLATPKCFIKVDGKEASVKYFEVGDEINSMKGVSQIDDENIWSDNFGKNFPLQLKSGSYAQAVEPKATAGLGFIFTSEALNLLANVTTDAHLRCEGIRVYSTLCDNEIKDFKVVLGWFRAGIVTSFDYDRGVVELSSATIDSLYQHTTPKTLPSVQPAKVQIQKIKLDDKEFSSIFSTVVKETLDFSVGYKNSDDVDLNINIPINIMVNRLASADDDLYKQNWEGENKDGEFEDISLASDIVEVSMEEAGFKLTWKSRGVYDIKIASKIAGVSEDKRRIIVDSPIKVKLTVDEGSTKLNEDGVYELPSDTTNILDLLEIDFVDEQDKKYQDDELEAKLSAILQKAGKPDKVTHLIKNQKKWSEIVKFKAEMVPVEADETCVSTDACTFFFTLEGKRSIFKDNQAVSVSDSFSLESEKVRFGNVIAPPNPAPEKPDPIAPKSGPSPFFVLLIALLILTPLALVCRRFCNTQSSNNICRAVMDLCSNARYASLPEDTLDGDSMMSENARRSQRREVSDVSRITNANRNRVRHASLSPARNEAIEMNNLPSYSTGAAESPSSKKASIPSLSPTSLATTNRLSETQMETSESLKTTELSNSQDFDEDPFSQMTAESARAKQSTQEFNNPEQSHHVLSLDEFGEGEFVFAPSLPSSQEAKTDKENPIVTAETEIGLPSKGRKIVKKVVKKKIIVPAGSRLALEAQQKKFDL